MAQRDETKAALVTSLDQVRGLIESEAFGDALNLGYRLGAQLQTIMDFDDAEARLIVDPTARDQALASLQARNYPSKAATP